MSEIVKKLEELRDVAVKYDDPAVSLDFDLVDEIISALSTSDGDREAAAVWIERIANGDVLNTDDGQLLTPGDTTKADLLGVARLLRAHAPVAVTVDDAMVKRANDAYHKSATSKSDTEHPMKRALSAALAGEVG